MVRSTSIHPVPNNRNNSDSDSQADGFQIPLPVLLAHAMQKKNVGTHLRTAHLVWSCSQEHNVLILRHMVYQMRHPCAHAVNCTLRVTIASSHTFPIERLRKTHDTVADLTPARASTEMKKTATVPQTQRQQSKWCSTQSQCRGFKRQSGRATVAADPTKKVERVLTCRGSTSQLSVSSLSANPN